MENQYQNQQQNQNNYQETSSQDDPKTNKAKDELGDYVEFEEIKEEEK
jgi:hypothetical protein